MQPRHPRAYAGRSLWILLAAILVCAAVVIVWRAFGGEPTSPTADEQRAAEVDRLARRRSAALVAASLEAQPGDPQLAVLLARAALRAADVQPAFERLHEAWQAAQPQAAFARHAGLVNAVRLTSDGRILTAGRDHEAILWNPQGSEGVRFSGHRGPVLDASVSPSGDRVLTASSDGTARLFDAWGDALTVLRGHVGAVRSARFDASGKRILTVGLDGDARLWSASDGVARILDDAGSATLEAHFLAAGTLVLTRDHRGSVRLFDEAGRLLEGLIPSAEIAAVRLAGDPDAPAALLLANDGSVLRFDAARRSAERLVGHEARVLDAAIARESGTIATASLDGTARLWSADGKPLRVLTGHGLAVVRVRVDGAGRRVLTLGADGAARLWNERGETLAVLAGPALRDVGYAAGGTVVWALPRDGPGLLLFDAAGAPRGSVHPEGAPLRELAFAPDGHRLAALTADRTLRLVVPTAERLLEAAAEVLARDFTAEEEARYLGMSAGDGSTGTTASGEHGPRPTFPTRSGIDDAGTAVCADCHRREYDLWVGSNHARTFEPAAPDNLPPIVHAGGTAEHPPGATAFDTSGGEFVARTVGADGEIHAFPLGWVAGRRRIRMYVTEMPDGRLQVLPAMRAELPDEWFDYTHLLFGGDSDTVPVVEPGDDAFWTGAGRSWGARCARCHSSGAKPRLPTSEHPGPRAVWRDLGVDCEACHGPGHEHAAAWARADTSAPLLKFGTLDRKASIEACTSCHMEGEVVRGDYRFGEDLYEYLDPTLLLDPERVDSRGRPLELIYHGLSFAVSRCAQEGRLTCVRCHDAHGGPHPALLSRAPTNHELCAECHVDLVREVATHSRHAATGTGGSCVGCHMPRLVIERGHGIITDHSIGVPDPEARGKGVARDACSWCHQGGLGAPTDVVQLPDERIRASYAEWWPEAQTARPWMLAVAAGRAEQPGAAPALIEVLEDPEQYGVVRATAARLLGRDATGNAEALFRAADDSDSLVRRSALRALGSLRGPRADAVLRDALRDASPAVRFAAARTVLEGWWRVQENADLLAAVLPVLEEDARAVPNDEMRWFRLGAASDVAGDVAGAIEAYGNMVELHPLARYVRGRLEELRAKPH